MKYLILAFLTFLLFGCASQPEDIGTAFVSPAQYTSYDCEVLASSLANKNRKLNSLYSSLKADAKADKWQMGVGLFIAWPALLLLEGGDDTRAEEYRQLKGEVEAMQEASLIKKCGFSDRIQ
jgi:hypothetical protein